MSFRLFACLSLLLVPLSGCIAGVGTMSAQSGLDQAIDHAEGLLDEGVAPVLVGVASIEPFQHYLEQDGDDEYEINTYADATQGDGKIPGWAYAFCVGDDVVVVFLAAGLGPLADYRETRECDEDDVQDYAIEGWEVDSDEAADILAERDDWPEPREDTVTLWTLAQMPDGEGSTQPFWAVETETLGGDDYAYALVNANTGEVVAIGDDYPDFGGDIYFAQTSGSCAIGSGSASSSTGLVPMVGNEVILNIDLPAEGDISFYVETARQLGDVTVTVEGPDGAVYSDVITAEAFGGDRISEDLEGLPAGDYLLRISPETVSSIGYGYEYEYSTC